MKSSEKVLSCELIDTKQQQNRGGLCIMYVSKEQSH